jgi:hypothetical protein
MQYRTQGTKTKLYRAIGGNRWKMLGSMPTTAGTVEEVPAELIKQLDTAELKNLHAWLRGASTRVAREAAKATHAAMLDAADRVVHMNERDRQALLRAAKALLDRLGDQPSGKNRSA